MKKAFLVLLISSAMTAVPAAFADASLFDRMGGAPVVAQVVDQLLELSMPDPRTRRSFQKINLNRLREKLNEQICALSNGPCQYTGDGMKEVPAGDYQLRVWHPCMKAEPAPLPLKLADGGAENASFRLEFSPPQNVSPGNN